MNEFTSSAKGKSGKVKPSMSKGSLLVKVGLTTSPSYPAGVSHVVRWWVEFA